MMEMAKVTSKGQITIPISIRRRLGINEGDKLLFINKPDGVMMVNPDMLGDQSDIIANTEDTAVATPTVAAIKKKISAPATVAAAEPDDDNAVMTDAAPVEEAARRPVPPPVEEPEKPEPQVGGLDLGTLLDDIRSIGSNI